MLSDLIQEILVGEHDHEDDDDRNDEDEDDDDEDDEEEKPDIYYPTKNVMPDDALYNPNIKHEDEVKVIPKQKDDDASGSGSGARGKYDYFQILQL